jgi:L,D-transpeptidase YcbB
MRFAYLRWTFLLSASFALPVLANEPLRPVPPKVAQAQPAPAVLSVPPPTGALALPSGTPAEPKPAAAGPTSRQPAASATSPSDPSPGARAPSAPFPKPPASLKFAAVSKDPRPTFDPDTAVNTLRAAERYHQIAEAGGWPALPKGTTLKMGDKGQLVAVLKVRLAATDDLTLDAASGDVFDDRVLAAVKRFQARHGLPETGLAGPKTVEALNIPATVRARQLTASAQRLAGSRFAFGERYAVVNIPSAAVEAVEKGQVVRRYVAVVGKKDRASPAVETRITNVNLNPTWTVPVSIIKKDIIPQMRKDASYLAKMKIRILGAQGQEIDPQKIDWSTERAGDFTLRQDPGASNSLGQIRIDMPNKHAVYMHDTPTKRLFARDDRFHSSGCVRVGNVREFAEWLLEGAIGPNGPWRIADLDAAIATAQRQDVKLAKPVPVAWVYLTGYATPDGTVHFRNDVYDLDKGDPATPQAPPDDLMTSSITRKPS